MAYKACFACELLFEVDPGLGESTRCPQCGGVLSDYDPSNDELAGKARDVPPAPTQANQAIVRTMSYKGLADAVREQIQSREDSGSTPGRPVPRGRGPAPRTRVTAARPVGLPQPASRATIPPRTGGLIPARRSSPGTDPLPSLSGGDLDDDGPQRKRPETAPLGSLDATAAELGLDDPDVTALPSTPAPARPAPVPARPAPVAARAVPVPARPASPAPPLGGPRPQGTKVLDAVADDATALDAAPDLAPLARDDSMVEDISMQSMHEPLSEDGSMLEDISMQSMHEPLTEEEAPGGYHLPATVALQADPNRPLPPIPGRAPAGGAQLLDPPRPAPQPASPFAPQPVQPQPVQPQPLQPQPVAQPMPIAQPRPAVAQPQPAQPQPAQPQPIQPAGPRPAMPQPIVPQAGPQPGSPFAARPEPRAGVPQPAPGAPLADGADAFAPVDFDVSAARKPRSKAPLIAVAVVLLLGAIGAAVWFFVLRGPDAPPVAETPPPEPVLTWSEKLEKQIEAGQAPLAQVSAAAPLEEAAWIAGGPEGMSTSLGLVTGMATSVIREGAAQEDEAGAFIPTVQKKLAEGSPGADAALLLAFPAEMKVSDFLLMADSGRRAGYGALAMVVSRADAPGQLGVLPFALMPRDAAPPEKGMVKVGIGKLGLHVTARDAQNKRLPEGEAEGAPPNEPRVPLANEAIDLDGFAARLAVLRAAQPTIERVVIHPAPDMTVGQLAPLLSRIYQGQDGQRFAEMALAL